MYIYIYIYMYEMLYVFHSLRRCSRYLPLPPKTDFFAPRADSHAKIHEGNISEALLLSSRCSPLTRKDLASLKQQNITITKYISQQI